tara:strand:+ start:6466 stop:8391 length:1926 start_codon:yes stop_codon:yes gene_type:complete
MAEDKSENFVPFGPERTSLTEKVTSPLEADKPQPRGFFSTIGTGLASGWNETSISYIGASAVRGRADDGIGDKISEDDYNRNPLRVESVPWDSNMTYELLDQIRTAHDSHATYTSAWNNSKLAGKAGLIVGGLIGTIPDPVNLISLGATGATFLARAAKAGAANAMAELVLTPFAESAYKARGMQYTTEMALTNMAFAAVIGGGFTAVMEGGAKAIRASTRAMGFNHEQPTLVDQIIKRYNEATDTKITLDPVTKDLIHRREIILQRATKDNIQDTNIIESGRTVYVDARGRIYNKPELIKDGTFISVENLAENIQITGDLRTLVKLSSTLLDKSIHPNAENKNFKLLLKDGPAEGITLTPEQFKGWTEAEITLLNRTTTGKNLKNLKVGTAIRNAFGEGDEFIGRPDPDYVFKLKDSNYEIHPDKLTGFDPNTMNGTLYQRVGNKKVEISDPAERIKIYKEVFESRLAKETPGKETPTKSDAQILSEKDPVDPNAQQGHMKNVNAITNENIKDKTQTSLEKEINENTDTETLLTVLQAKEVQNILDQFNTSRTDKPPITLEDLRVISDKDGRLEYKQGDVIGRASALDISPITARFLDKRLVELKLKKDREALRKQERAEEKTLHECSASTGQISTLGEK